MGSVMAMRSNEARHEAVMQAEDVGERVEARNQRHERTKSQAEATSIRAAGEHATRPGNATVHPRIAELRAAAAERAEEQRRGPGRGGELVTTPDDARERRISELIDEAERSVGCAPADTDDPSWRSEVAGFLEDEVVKHRLRAALPAAVTRVIEWVALFAPWCRLDPVPTSAWDVVRGYSDRLAEPELCDEVFPEASEAFVAGFDLGVALATHDPGDYRVREIVQETARREGVADND
jgi:hypothetical protein